MKRVRTKVTGSIYLLHFLEALGNGTARGSAQHYTGFTTDLDARLADHRAGRGARIMQVLAERGVDFKVADVHPGNQDLERLLKQHSAARRCPVCTPGRKLPGVVVKVIEAEERRQARAARKAAKEAREKEAWEAMAPKAPATDGQRYAQGARRAAALDLALMSNGMSAAQIEAGHERITAPYFEYERPHSRASETEMRGYHQQVNSDLALLQELEREDEAERARLESGREADRELEAG